jgi:2,5-dioxopentanoate dehydrogenase
MKYPSGKNVIGYSLKAAGNRFFFGVNPDAEEEIPNQFIQATEKEVNETCELAQKAFPVYSSLVLEKRLKFISAIVAEIHHHFDSLCELMVLETGLPADRAKTELNRSIYQFEQYAEAVRSGYAFQVKTDEPQKDNPYRTFDLRKMNVPIGPVVVFGASNFPFAYSTLGGDVASALVAGCPVIVKAHALHPNTAALSAQCIAEAAKKTQMPEGVFSQLYASDFTVGAQLVSHPMVQGVGFTGSIAGGKALLEIAQKRKIPIPVYAEMGSVNPVVICADALDSDWKTIADKLVASISLNVGQFCTSPGILFVEQSSNRNLFLQQVIEGLSKVPLQVMLGKGILQNYRSRIEEIKQLFPLDLEGNITSNSISPSVIKVSSEIFMKNKVLHEEVFGSFVCIVECENQDEIVDSLNVLDGQLTGSIFTNSCSAFDEICSIYQHKVGRIIINGVPTGVEVSLAQQHGGPFPGSSSFLTSVGSDAVLRWLRPITLQNAPFEWLPDLLRK